MLDFGRASVNDRTQNVQPLRSIARHRQTRRGLRQRAQRIFFDDFEGRALDFDSDAADVYGERVTLSMRVNAAHFVRRE